jgi:hypothetical protein
MRAATSRRSVIDELGPSDLSKLAADYDEATQEAKNTRGNPLAKFVIGLAPGCQPSTTPYLYAQPIRRPTSAPGLHLSSNCTAVATGLSP